MKTIFNFNNLTAVGPASSSRVCAESLMASKASFAIRLRDPDRGMARPLADLEVGEHATIVDVSAPGPIRERLLDLGFVPGTRVTLVRRAPLGDPCVYALRGVMMCLRAQEAARISVQLASPPDA